MAGGRPHGPRGHGPAGGAGAPVLGIVYLADVAKGGRRERFDRPRAMGIRTVMKTGHNPFTAGAVPRLNLLLNIALDSAFARAAAGAR
jgi:K+-transporting ATPase ATPase B chain